MIFKPGGVQIPLKYMHLTIDLMNPADWPAVRDIYLQGIATGHATFETTPPDWEQWDAGHLVDCRLAARRLGRLIGWAALSPVSHRAVYAGVAEVSVYVSTDARRQRIGDGLMDALVSASEQHGFWALQSSIFPENEASLKMHLRHRFRLLGRRERIARLHGVWRDTILLERRSHVVGIDEGIN